MGILELGHTGLYVNDLEVMADFYEHIVGLTVTGRDQRLGMVFLSSQPDLENHELLLVKGRQAPSDVKLSHQISWRVDSLETLLEFHRRFREENVDVQQEVTHGNAFGIYFYDPERNRNEVYLRFDRDVRQPFKKSLNLDLSPEEIFEQAEQLLAGHK